MKVYMGKLAGFCAGLVLILMGIKPVSVTAFVLETPRTGKVGCHPPGVLTLAGSDAGREIRDIAAVSSGYYCKHSVDTAPESRTCSAIIRDRGIDQCRYSNPSDYLHDGVSHEPLRCFRSLLPSELSEFYRTHWLKEDAVGLNDKCNFALSAYRLVCASGYNLVEVLPGMVTNSQQRNNYSCRNAGPPTTYLAPSWRW